MLETNIPEILAELVAAFRSYERALVDNDIPAVNALFWDSTFTLRYGTKVTEAHYGRDAIAAFRLCRGIVDQRRMLRNQHITTFGHDFGIANTEFIPEGSDKIGRQSQTWVRTPDGWKIVSAHVSYGI
jgi:hypothetical protein